MTEKPISENNCHLKAQGLVKSYRRRRVVDSVDLNVTPHEIVGLLGPNGAGKTTTFYMLTGLVAPNSGKVIHNGADVTRLAMHRRARRGIGYLPQEASIFRKLTVEENLRLVLEAQDMPRREREKKIDGLLDEFKIQRIRKSPGYVLSGGERRRVEIARALATGPQFLLLDEPFTGIDPISVQELQGLMRELRDRGIGIVITDHNVRETLEITDRAYIIYEGRVLLSGTSMEILRNETARKLYLGDRFSMDIQTPDSNGAAPEKTE